MLASVRLYVISTLAGVAFSIDALLNTGAMGVVLVKFDSKGPRSGAEPE